MGRRFKSAGIPPDGLLVADGDRLRLPRNLGRLRTLIKDIGAGLIVLDSLRRLAPGVRENESDDMAVVIAELGTLARDLDVAIVLIHHRSTKHGGATLRGSSRSRIRPVYLERHAASVRPRTITTLRDRLRHAIRAFGDVRLHELEHMTDEIAAWQARLPPRAGHGIAQALRQVLGAAVRWQHIDRNPAILAGRNPKPPPRAVRAFTTEEIAAIAAELSVRYQPLPAFAAATGLRPEEWQALERRDVHRHAGILVVRRTVSSGVVVELTKTTGSRREVPLTGAARAALDAVAPRLDTGLLFPASGGGLINLDNFRRREWAPAVEASGTRTPARIYDLRSTFASRALAAGAPDFELARVMGTSIEMIERHDGTLLDGSAAGFAERMDAYESDTG